ncbi:MAG: hypothetical protein ACHRHE_08890 [Tepidisphaerales bacterium]
MLTRTQADQLGRALSLWPYNTTIVTRPRVTVFEWQEACIVLPGDSRFVVGWSRNPGRPLGFAETVDTAAYGLQLSVIPAVTADQSSVFLQLRAQVLGVATIPFPDAPPGADLNVGRAKATPIGRIDRNFMCKDGMTAVFLLPGNSRYEKAILTVKPIIITHDPWMKYRQEKWPQLNSRPAKR